MNVLKLTARLALIGSLIFANGCASDDPLPETVVLGQVEYVSAVSSTTTTLFDVPDDVATQSVVSAVSVTPWTLPVVPEVPETLPTTTTTTTAPARAARATRAEPPADVLAAIQELWPEAEWDRALAVAWCESNYRLDAANPTSSARGVFQTLAPWTRAPGTGKTVYGWEYDPDTGEKLSAAAGLGISEEDARTGLGNIRVAYEIWVHGGWSAWAPSAHCSGVR